MVWALVWLVACGSAEVEVPDSDPHSEMAHGEHDHSQHEALAAVEPVMGASLYQLDVSLTDHHGQPFELASLEGHPVVISMIYTTCTSACPMIVQAIQGLEPSLPDDAQVVLVSFDPERDSVDKLAAYAETHGLGGRWHLLRADESDVRELAAVLGIRYRKLSNGDFNHSSVFTRLDEHGVITARVDGLGSGLDALR